jgi:predicted N-acyltransferase
MDNKFISYEYVFNNFHPEDSFYDKELMRYEVIQTSLNNGMVKEIKVVDESGSISSIYNLTKLTRILLSMGITSRIKNYIFWDKPLLLTEDFADKLMDEQHKDIVDEYKNMLLDGVQKGLISDKEYRELMSRVVFDDYTI